MKKKKVLRLSLMTALLLTLALVVTSWAIEPSPLPPVLTVCDEVTCETLQESVCSAAGFKITLTNYEPATTSNNGTATYTYEICNPRRGTCVSTVRLGEGCLDNTFCQSKEQETDPIGYCNRECAVDTFSDLSHFDVTTPELGCQGGNIEVTWDCVCSNSLSEACWVEPAVVPGDASCFTSDPDYTVAKCNVSFLAPGACFVMTVSISGETAGLGLGAAIFVGASDLSCTASCLAGPSCEPCEEGGPACLVRTIGFWGTHPHIAAEYDPVTVCGVVVEGQQAGTCSTSEALCFNANDYKQNPPYLSFVAQLTAAKLNLNATKKLFGDSCNTWVYQEKSIQKWIEDCEKNFCGASKQAISATGCIEALTAFNESQDTGFELTPPPFDSPGPANPRQCQAARGNGIFIGNCAEEAPPADHQKDKK